MSNEANDVLEKFAAAYKALADLMRDGTADERKLVVERYKPELDRLFTQVLFP